MDPGDAYLERHSIDELLHELRRSMAQERSPDPLRYLRFLVERKIEQAQMRPSILSPSRAGATAALSSDEVGTSCLSYVNEAQRRQSLNSLIPLQDRLTLWGLDVGGSLSKLTVYEPPQQDCNHRELEFVKQSLTYGSTGRRDTDLAFQWQGGTFHFLSFETRRMNNAIELMQKHHLLTNEQVLLATGGGAHKFQEDITRSFNLHVVKGDELSCLLAGINFMLLHSSNECYFLVDPQRPLQSEFASFGQSCSVFPYLLVNIGSGVSILKVDSSTVYQRVSGTCIGGGTYWGLCRLLTKFESFEQATKMAEKGNQNNVNMLVGDIYGGDYQAFDLTADTCASAFGKVGAQGYDIPRSKVADEDISRALLDMIAQNIAQLAYLCARKYGLTRIIFAGNFLRNNRLSMGSIAFSIDYWSHGVMKALFLKHEGYFGSMGAFLLQDPDRWLVHPPIEETV